MLLFILKCFNVFATFYRMFTDIPPSMHVVIFLQGKVAELFQKQSDEKLVTLTSSRNLFPLVSVFKLHLIFCIFVDIDVLYFMCHVFVHTHVCVFVHMHRYLYMCICTYTYVYAFMFYVCMRKEV